MAGVSSWRLAAPLILLVFTAWSSFILYGAATSEVARGDYVDHPGNEREYPWIEYRFYADGVQYTGRSVMYQPSGLSGTLDVVYCRKFPWFNFPRGLLIEHLFLPLLLAAIGVFAWRYQP